MYKLCRYQCDAVVTLLVQHVMYYTICHAYDRQAIYICPHRIANALLKSVACHAFNAHGTRTLFFFFVFSFYVLYRALGVPRKCL